MKRLTFQSTLTIVFSFLSLLIALSSCHERLNTPLDPDIEETASTEILQQAFEQVLEAELSQENERHGFGNPLSTAQTLQAVNQLTGEFSTLLAALSATGLASAFDGPDKLTLIAPLDAAFANLGVDASNVGNLDPAVLSDLLLYHATPGKRSTGQLLHQRSIRMANKCFAKATRRRYRIMINDSRLITPFLVNIPTATGFIHLTWKVLDPAKGAIMPPNVDGLAYSQSSRDVSASFNEVDQALTANPNIGVVARINHAANAANVGLSLRPTQLILFGNPSLGTPLMQINQTAGIDLPQKILFYENGEGEVFASYNSTDYLAARHGVGQAATLPVITGALANFTRLATGCVVVPPENPHVQAGEGLVSHQSANSVDASFNKLVTAVTNNPNLRIIAQIDHAANAASRGLTLRPTKLLIFGNPNLGTPLMQSKQTAGIDLPQKMLIYEDANGDVQVVYNDPYYVAQRHGLSNVNPQLQIISGALANLAGVATTP